MTDIRVNGHFEFVVIITGRTDSNAVHDETIVGVDFSMVFIEVGRAEAGPARHGDKFRSAAGVMLFSFRAGNFFEAVASYISAGVEGDIPDSVVTGIPEVIDGLAIVEVIIFAALNEFGIVRTIVENNDMVVGATEAFAIFPTAEET